MQGMLGQIAGFAFQIPAALGLGKHWPLDPVEEKNWGRALDGCLRSLPAKNKAKAIKTLTGWLPWISLMMTGYMTIMPRIMESNLGKPRERPTPAASPDGANRPDSQPRRSPDGPDGRILSWEDYPRYAR